MTITQPRDLAEVGGKYQALRGLLLVPTGVLFIAAGLFNMPPIGDEPVSGMAWYFVGVSVLVGIGYLVVYRYYVTTFGRVRPSRRTQVRVAVYTALAAAAICVGITVDSQFDLPVTLYLFGYAMTLLLYYRLFVGLKPYHWALLGGLAVLSVIPVWNVGDKVSVAMVPMGLATIAIGVFDHRELVESFRQMRAVAQVGDIDADLT